MNNINVRKMLEKLIELTKSNSISWEYLDSRKSLCKELCLEGKTPIQLNTGLDLVATLSSISSTELFDADNSFVAKINDNYIVIYCKINVNKISQTIDERLVFMLVPRTYKDIFTYRSDGNDGTLLRLQMLVKSFFPSAADIANDILNM